MLGIKEIWSRAWKGGESKNKGRLTGIALEVVLADELYPPFRTQISRLLIDGRRVNVRREYLPNEV
jgi:hypothetical protein